MKHFKLFPAVLVLIMAIVLVRASHLSAAVTFWDDFDGNSLDPAKWGYQDRNWPIGQTWFRGTPTVSGGVATFEHHTYNPYNPGSGYYDSVHHWGENPVVPTLDLTEFNTFKILWSADSVQWYWDPDQIRGQDLYPDVLISETSSVIPDEPLTLRMNFWAPTSDWFVAWDSAMHPTSNPADDIVCYYDVDYFRTVQIPGPASLVLVVIGLLSLRCTRRLRS